jgi:hypothetical protein
MNLQHVTITEKSSWTRLPPRVQCTFAAERRVFDSIVGAIGDTPIMRLRKTTYAHGIRARILAKLAD